MVPTPSATQGQNSHFVPVFRYIPARTRHLVGRGTTIGSPRGTLRGRGWRTEGVEGREGGKCGEEGGKRGGLREGNVEEETRGDWRMGGRG